MSGRPRRDLLIALNLGLILSVGGGVLSAVIYHALTGRFIADLFR